MTTPGTVALICGATARWTAVQQCLARLELPPGSVIEHIAGSLNIAQNRNIAAVGGRGEWLWMLDDDQLFAPDCLLRLLAHFQRDDVDVVVPHVLRRGKGHQHVLAGAPPVPGACPVPLVVKSTDRGLIPVYAAGTGGMLIRKRVIASLPPPWFELGRYNSGNLDEDIWFCDRAQRAGFKVWCDLDTAMGHICALAVWPQAPGDGWTSAYQFLPPSNTQATIDATTAMAARARSAGEEYERCPAKS